MPSRWHPVRSEAPWALTRPNAQPAVAVSSEAAALALSAAQTFAQSIVSITSALGKGSLRIADEAVTIPDLQDSNASNAGIKLNICACLAHCRRRSRRSFGLPHAPGLPRARGQTAPILEFPPTGGPRRADGSGWVGGAQAVVAGAVPVFEGGFPRNMKGQAENLLGDPPIGRPSEPTASEAPNPPATAPSHMFPNQVRDYGPK